MRGASGVPPRLVDQGGHDRGERRRVEAAPYVVLEALGREQVLLGVDALQHPAPVGHPGTVAVEVAQLSEQVADAVEGARHRVGAAVDVALQAVGLPPQLPPSLRPACVLLAVGAVVTRMLP